MAAQAPLSSFSAIVVAAGQGSRAGLGVPKQLAPYRGKPLVCHSVSALLAAGAKSVVIAVPAGMGDEVLDACGHPQGVSVVEGGETRQLSVRNALSALEGAAAPAVLIHDAARPELPIEVIARLLAALERQAGAIPVLPVIDSLALDEEGLMIGSAPRERLRRVQTPQAFRFPDILAAHRAWQGKPDAGDDAQVLRSAGGIVALVDGDERLRKLTFAEDFAMQAPAIRTGMGFDVHRLVEGEELWLGGIRIDSDKGLSGHSDADVAIHALVDALLGAIGDGDIGTHFPPSEPRWKGASSDRFLVHARHLVEAAGYQIANIDLTIICEAPKIGPHRPAMRGRLADLLGVDVGQVSVKATTTERLGFAGRGEGIAAQAIATVARI